MNASWRSLHPLKVTVSVLFGTVSVLLTLSGAWAQPVTAQASGRWFSDWDTPPAAKGTAAAGATATAGANTRALAGTPKQTDPQISNTYDKGGVVWNLRTLGRAHVAASTLSYALPQKYNANNNTFNYVVSAGAFVFIEPTWVSAAEATATANDPQLVDSLGLFGETLVLGSGSDLFASPMGLGLGPSSSSLHFEYDALNILSLPLASINISDADGANPSASVVFNSDPRLHFYVAGSSSTPITADEVTAILNDPSIVSQLTSLDGLLSDLPLFHFTMDLTNSTLSPDAGFGAMTAAQADGVGVPEPATLALLGLGLAGLGFVRRNKR